MPLWLLANAVLHLVSCFVLFVLEKLCASLEPRLRPASNVALGLDIASDGWSADVSRIFRLVMAWTSVFESFSVKFNACSYSFTQ